MAKAGIIMMIAGILFAGYRMYNRAVVIETEYDTEIGNYWYMFDESSTIEDKAVYMDKYIDAVEKSNTAQNSGIFKHAPSNSYEYNLNALKSLRDRLNQIRGMDPNSFQYQTAIHQITEQEANSTSMNVVEKCWMKANHYSYYNWIIWLLLALIQVALVWLGFHLWIDD